MSQFHVAITRRVRPGMEAAFESALQDFARRSLHAPGTKGVHLLGPVPGGKSNEYGILRSFENESASRDFYASPLYRDWEETVAPLVEGPPVMRELHGLEAFFRDAGMRHPPRWKMAIVTWIGVFPTVWLWSSTLPKLLDGLHPIATMAIVNLFVVATLAWLAMPLLTRLFAGWLHPPDRTTERAMQ
jgi:antibiotic biosynthesis monooxygenase (ABM) superfamily enzyme